MKPPVMVLNGWAAGNEIWERCTFHRDWLFSYLEQLDGAPEKVLARCDSAVLVGFSMGGSTALRLMLANPAKVHGLVLISTTARMMEERETGWKGMSLRRRAALKLGTQMTYRDNPSPLFDEANLDRGLDYLQNGDLRAELRDFAARNAVAGGTPFPVEIIQSERDFIVYPHNAEFLKSVLPEATVTMVAGNEHVLPLSVSDIVDDAVKRIWRT